MLFPHSIAVVTALAFLGSASTLRADLLCPELHEASSNLTTQKSATSELHAQLNRVESAGPGTLALLDRLQHLREVAPGEIRTERERFRSSMEERSRKLETDSRARHAELSRNRALLVSKHATELAARKAKYNSLVTEGPKLAGLAARQRSAREKLASLQKEKRRVLDDLRNGRFCSLCDGAQFDFEKRGEDFFAHLKKVGGTVVMKPEKIKAREADFDRRIVEQLDAVEEAEEDIDTEKTRHARDQQAELAAIARLETDGPQQVAALDRQITVARTSAETARSELKQAIERGEKVFEDRENARASEENAAAQQTEERKAAYEARCEQLRAAIRQAQQQQLALERNFDAAAAKCRELANQRHERSLTDAATERKEQQHEREIFHRGTYEQVGSYETARRTALDEGRPLPTTSAMTSKLQALKADFWHNVDTIGSTDQASGAPAGDWLGERAAGIYRELPEPVRKRIDSNIETFSSVRKTARAVIRDSLGRVRSGLGAALLNNALGTGNGLAPDVAVAIEKGRPDLRATVKGQLMPTVEALAVEQIVDVREYQERRRFKAQERIAERGFARTWLATGNLKKHFDSLFETFNEAMDTAMINLSAEPEGEE